MRPCSGVIGRIACPCDGYVTGSSEGACDACSHSFANHFQPPALSPQPSSSSTELAPGRAQSAASLFKRLLKSTQNGAAALQETSSGLRKRNMNVSVDLLPSEPFCKLI